MEKPEHCFRITQEEWNAMDERVQRWMAQRARPGEHKQVGYGAKDKEGNHIKIVPLRAGWCPCGKCDHTWMMDCHAEDCECCTHECT